MGNFWWLPPLFKGIGEIDPQALPRREVKALLFEQQPQLEGAPRRKGAMKQLKPEDPGQEALGNVGSPAPGLALGAKGVVNQGNDAVQKGSRAASRVQDQGVPVGQPPRAVKAVLE